MLRWTIDLLILLGIIVGPSYHLFAYAKANGGLGDIYAGLAAHSASYVFFQIVIFIIAFVGPYCVIALSRISSKSTVSDVITLIGCLAMVVITYIAFPGDAASPSFKWAVVLLPVILFPLAFVVLIVSVIFREKSS